MGNPQCCKQYLASSTVRLLDVVSCIRNIVIMSFKESERKFTPFKFDFRKYVPIKYYAPPEEVNDEELDRQLSQFEDKIK